MDPDEARRILDAWLKAEHGLCEHDVLLTAVKGCWKLRMPCAWPDCPHPLHQPEYGHRRLRHTVYWPDGAAVWMTLKEEQVRALAAAKAAEAAT